MIDLVLVFASRKERDPFSIRTPARMRLVIVSICEWAIFRAIPFRQPEVAGHLVFLHVRRFQDIDDEIPVRRKLWLVHIAQPGVIFRF